MRIKEGLAIAASTFLVGGSLHDAQADGAPAPDPALVEFCVNEALGVSSTKEREHLNPADAVGSGYIGKSLVRFYFEATANAVSDDCKDVIRSRTIEANQIYKNKDNTPHSVVFNSLGKLSNQRKAVRLKVPFSGIPGPKVRGYIQKVTTTVDYVGGRYSKTGKVTVRGNTDGV